MINFTKPYSLSYTQIDIHRKYLKLKLSQNMDVIPVWCLSAYDRYDSQKTTYYLHLPNEFPTYEITNSFKIVQFMIQDKWTDLKQGDKEYLVGKGIILDVSDRYDVIAMWTLRKSQEGTPYDRTLIYNPKIYMVDTTLNKYLRSKYIKGAMENHVDVLISDVPECKYCFVPEGHVGDTETKTELLQNTQNLKSFLEIGDA